MASKLRTSPSKKEKPSPSRDLWPYIKKERLQASLTIETVAAYLEVPITTLEAYENGTKQIPLFHIYALSNCIGLDPNFVASFLNPKNK